MHRFVALAVCLSVCGCGASAQPAASRAAQPPPAKAPWKLVVRMSYGPCADDGRPCSGSWTATPDGQVTEELGRGVPGGPRTRSLTPDELSKLRALVASDELRSGLASGFACQGPKDGSDAVWELMFTNGKGETTKRRFEHCISGEPDKKNLPRDLLAILRH